MFEQKYNKIRNILVAIESVLFVIPVLTIVYLAIAGFPISVEQLLACVVLVVLTPIVICSTVYYMNEIY